MQGKINTHYTVKNNTVRKMKHERGYYDMFVRTCATNPSNIAVIHYDDGVYKTYTYSELFGICEYISQNLQILKCTKGIIGLLSERNILTPCVIAAAHKCNTSFMFLNPTQDNENLIKDIKFSVIIAIGNRDSISKTKFLNQKPKKSISLFDLNIDFYSFEGQSQKNVNNGVDFSFIAMTSGSTGEPKPIEVPIQCIQPNIDDLSKLFDIESQDVIYFSTPLTFDPSMIEVLLACSTGASLMIAPEKADILFPKNKEYSITFWQTTPSKFFQYSNADINNKILSASSTLKILALGGEPLNGIRRLKELKEKGNKTKIYTLYGVTEMSCWACVAELDLNSLQSDREVPLGNCLSETQLIVEPYEDNKKMGKIILASETRRCFLLNRSSNVVENSSLKLVDTGDIGETINGTIYYRGRRDDIVKRFGHKINMQHIETVTMLCPRIKACSCVWLPKPLLLILYFSSKTMSGKELSDFLKCKLDERHWPDKLIRIDNLPINSHGKIAKKILSKMHENMNATQTTESLQLMFMKELRLILNENLTYDEIKEKPFFSIGGTSFLAVSMCNRLSTCCSSFGKLILPYLLSDNYTIEYILKLASTEICNQEKPRKRFKKARLSSESEVPMMKNSSGNAFTNAIEFFVLWKYDTRKCVDASPTLHRDGHVLYVAVGSHSGTIVVIDAIFGTLRGKITLNSRIEATILCYDTPTGAHAVVGTYDGTVVCFKLSTCEELWRLGIGVMIKSKAIYCSGHVYVACYDGKIKVIDAKVGVVKQTLHIAEQAISADLVVGRRGFVVAAALSGAVAGIHAAAGAVAWRANLASPVFAAPVLYDADKCVVFAEVSGHVHCRTVEKGIQIWRYEGAKGNIFSSIYVKEIDKLQWQFIFGCHDNNVYNVCVKNFQPSLNWRVPLGSPVYSTPQSLSEKLLLVASSKGKLCVLDVDNGVTLAEYNLPGETFSTPAIYGDCIFIGCRDDHLYGLKYNLNL